MLLIRRIVFRLTGLQLAGCVQTGTLAPSSEANFTAFRVARRLRIGGLARCRTTSKAAHVIQWGREPYTFTLDKKDLAERIFLIAVAQTPLHERAVLLNND
jgi:hypothetical protein